MLCQKCGERQATFHYQQNINGKKSELYLCEHCRREMGLDDFVGNSMNWNDFFGVFDSPLSLLGGTSSFMQETPQRRNNPIICEHCGMRYEDFKNGGTLGCGHCYETFKDRLDGVLKRLHGSNRHKGRMPETVQTVMDSKKTDAESTADTTASTSQTAASKQTNTASKTAATNPTAADSTTAQPTLTIKELKAKIKEAIKNEEYEQAAQWRDMIRQMEAGEEQ